MNEKPVAHVPCVSKNTRKTRAREPGGLTVRDSIYTNKMYLIMRKMSNIMKTKNNRILFIIPLIVCRCIIGCSKDKCPDTPDKGGTHNVSWVTTPYLMPYKDFDTVRFLKNNTDTDLFIGGQIQPSYYHAFDAYPCPREESLQDVKYSFINSTNIKLVLHAFVLPANNDYADRYEIIYNQASFGPYAAARVAWCGLSREQITVLGKNYCASKLEGAGGDYLYFGDTSGIVKFYINNNRYELIPK